MMPNPFFASFFIDYIGKKYYNEVGSHFYTVEMVFVPTRPVFSCARLDSLDIVPLSTPLRRQVQIFAVHHVYIR